MASVYVSIGSNINRETNICACMQHLQRDFGKVVFSPVYETPAAGFSGAPFLNLAAGFTTMLTPSALKQYLRQLEAAHGRVRGEKKFSARTLDVDLLLYDNLNLQPEHNLPHNDIVAYAFVLFPLADIAPTAQHPVLQCSIAALAQASTLSRTEMRVVALDCGTLTPS